MSKKKKNTKYIVVAVVIVAILLMAIVAVGYIGLVRVPGISPSPQNYSNAYDITDQAYTLYGQLQQYGDSDLPPLADIQSYGLEFHIYGTDDSMSVVAGHFDGVLGGWNVEHDESGTYWSVKIWRSIAYGFAVLIWSHPQLKAVTGYNTIYMTVDGSITAWMNFMDAFD